MNQNKSPESELPQAVESIESDDTTENDPSDFLLRMEEIFKATKTESDHLRELQKNDPEALESELEELVDEVCDQDAGYKQVFANLRKARRDGADETVFVQQLKDLRNKIDKIIRSESGLFDDSAFTQIENAKNEISSLIHSPESGFHTEDPAEALAVLGIVSKKDDGSENYTFPYDRMPDSVVKKWKIYLAAVCKHVQAADSVMITGNKTAVEVADRARTYAHNSVTDDVHAILGLEGIGGWNRTKTRMLLGTIRDHELPTYESTCDANAKELVSSNSNEIRVASILSSKSHES